MELMIFATENIYRETGTASKHVEDKTFSMEHALNAKNGEQTLQYTFTLPA